MMDKALYGASLQQKQMSTMHKVGRIIGDSSMNLQNKRIRLDDVATTNIRK